MPPADERARDSLQQPNRIWRAQATPKPGGSRTSASLRQAANIAGEPGACQ